MFNIFRVYEQNHPENLVIKPKTRQSAPEIDFTPKVQLTFEAPKLSVVPSVAPLLEQESVTADAQEAIFRITDINEMIAAGRFAAAEYLLGRKLTMDEVRDKMVRDLMKAPEKEVDQIRKEILRDQLKAKMAAQMTADAAAKQALIAAAAGPRQLGPPGPPGPPPGPPPPPMAPRPGQAPQSQPRGNVPLRHVPPPPPPLSQLPKLPPSPPPSSPKGSSVASGSSDYVADFIDFMNAKQVPEVKSKQMLTMKTADLLAALASSPGAGDTALREEMAMKQALARYESLLRGEKVAEDEVTDKLNELATRLGATIPLMKAVAMDSADLNTELHDMGLDPAKVAEIVATQAEVQEKLNFKVVLMSPSPPPAGGAPPAKLVTRAELKALPVGTEAEKKSTAETLWKSYQMTLDPKARLSPQEIFEGRLAYKNWITDVLKEAAALPVGKEKLSTLEFKQKKVAFKKAYDAFPELKKSSSLDVKVIHGIIAGLEKEAADKLEEIQKYPGVKTTGSGVVNRKTRAQWIPFGPKYVLNYDKFRQGIFSLAYPKTGQPPLWTGQVTLTRPLRIVLEAFLNNEPADQQDLDKQEKTWVNHVFHKAGIIKEPPNLLPKQRQIRSQRDMAERMKVLLGEQSAGNDSPLILKELGTLSQKMASRGYITSDQLQKIEQLIALG